MTNQEPKFLFSIRAYKEISAICPDHEIKNISWILDGAGSQTLGNLAKIAEILNRAACKAYGGEPMNAADFLALPPWTLRRVIEKARNEIKSGEQQEVRARPKKTGAGHTTKPCYTWYVYHALRLGAGWPNALDMPIGLLRGLMACDQIANDMATELFAMSHEEVMELD